MQEIYNPPSFLTANVLNNILQEFSWAKSFRIGDDGCSADGIEVKFEKCSLFFVEGYESEISLYFTDVLNPNEFWSFTEVLNYIFVPDANVNPDFIEPTLIEYFSPIASLEKAENGVRDICNLIEYYFLPCLNGDFNWIKRFRNITFSK